MSNNRLLIIDDDPDMSVIVTRVAKSCGYEVESTTNAEEFQKINANWRPTHISLDLQMPGMDGIEIIRYLATQHSRAQILVMSGFDAKVVESARRLGTERGLTMAGTISKPVSVTDLQKIFANLKLADDVIDGKAVASAIENRELFMLYQPKIQLARMDVSHFEALVRWRHPSRGTVAPDNFIHVAERADLINALTHEVARMAVHQVSMWRGANLPVEVAINISGKDLSDVKFADELKHLCETAGVNPNWITLELTETAAAANAADAIDILTRLRLMGFRISIDDFGTGYSSLTQLHRLPFSELKIDKEFVNGCVNSDDNRVIVKTIVDLAHNLRLSVVAEGAEDKPTVDHLRQLGCDYVQGYYFSRPLQADQTVPWMEGWLKQRPQSAAADTPG